MQPTELSTQGLEELYKAVILPQFGLDTHNIKWERKAHVEIDLDCDAHYFKLQKERYVLIFEDYPNHSDEEFADMTVNTLREAVEPVALRDHSPTGVRLRFGPSETPFMYAHNVTGYFHLFRIFAK